MTIDQTRLLARLGSPAWSLPGPVHRLFRAPDGPWLGVVTLAEAHGKSVVQVLFMDESSGATEKAHAFSLEGVARLAVSADGSCLVSVATGEAVMRVWDLAARAHLRDLPILSPEVRDHHHMQFSPDGRRLAVAGGGELRLWDIASGELLHRSPRSAPMHHVLVLAGENGLVWNEGLELWYQPGSGAPARRLLEGHHVWALAASPEGDRIAVTSRFVTRIVRIVSGQAIVLTGTPSNGANTSPALDFSSDGRCLVRAASTYPLDLWRMLDARKARDLGRLGENVTSVSFSRDGSALFVGTGARNKNAGGLLERVDLATGRWETLALHGWRSLEADQEATWMLEDPGWPEPTTPRLWNFVGSGSPRRLPRRDSCTRGVLAPSTGRIAITRYGDGQRIQILDPDEPESSIATHPTDHVLPHGWSPDGTSLLGMTGYREVRLHRLSDSSQVWNATLDSHHANNFSCAVDPAFTHVAQVGSGRVQVTPLGAVTPLWSESWSTEGHRTDHGGLVVIHHAATTHAAIVGDGRILVAVVTVGPAEDQLVSWELLTGRRLARRQLEAGVKSFAHYLVQIWGRRSSRLILPDATPGAAAYLVWDAATGEELARLPLDGDPLSTSVGLPALSPGGDLLAVPHAGAVDLHCIPGGDLVDHIETGADLTSPISMTWLNAPRRLVTSGPGQSYLIWNMEA